MTWIYGREAGKHGYMCHLNMSKIKCIYCIFMLNKMAEFTFLVQLCVYCHHSILYICSTKEPTAAFMCILILYNNNIAL